MTQPKVTFEKPPVVEVVCGMTFTPLKKMLAPHLGLLWSRYAEEFPTCAEVAPLDPVIETFGRPKEEIQVEMSAVPPLPRIWFTDGSGNSLIQVQRDRFLYNWRRAKPSDEYPTYRAVLGRFSGYFATFEALLGERKLGCIEPMQYELTYVDQMNVNDGWTRLDEIAKLLPDFAWRDSPKRFLTNLEGINCTLTFQLPERTGRLRVTVKSANRRDNNQQVLLVETTARGIGHDRSREGMWRWFDAAHEWIGCAFLDLASEYAQNELWRRKA